MSGKENFIPIRRSDIAQLCEAECDHGNKTKFNELSELMLALLHHEALHTLSELKDAYAPFNPDRDTVPVIEQDENDCAKTLYEYFDKALLAGNYIKLSEEDLDVALEEAALIPLDTNVNKDDYEYFAFYYRGEAKKKIPVKWLWKTKEVEIDNLERVAVLLRFKDNEHFDQKTKKEKKRQADFVPGKIYLYLYKDVPKNDLELLFPNVEISMTMKDKLMFAIPAIASFGPLIIKILPSLGLLLGLILLLTMGPEFAKVLDFDHSKAKAIYPIMVAVLSTSFMLGGFAVKQYLNYKNKTLQFQKRVTDTLFFKNLVTNRGVLFTVVDGAEEELGKQMLLAYFHLHHANQPLTAEELDKKVEKWLHAQCDRSVDFDVTAALEHLESYKHNGQSIVTQTEGKWTAVSIDDAKSILDSLWDNLYQY